MLSLQLCWSILRVTLDCQARQYKVGENQTRWPDSRRFRVEVGQALARLLLDRRNAGWCSAVPAEKKKRNLSAARAMDTVYGLASTASTLLADVNV